jgi:large subunit ribosomal protein L18
MFMYRAIRHRRLKAATNYKRRVAALKGGMKRLVVRKSNRSITLQIVEYGKDGDRVVASTSSRELKGIGWEPRCNIPTAYLTGMLLARKADRDSEYILDIGLYRPVKGSLIFAAAKGFSDSGAKLRNSIEFDEKRLAGEHIAKYAALAGNEGNQFSAYAKAGFDVKEMQNKFNEAKRQLSAAK